MSGRTRPIDLGPMYLPVGEQVDRWPVPVRPEDAGARAGDVDRFKAAMQAGDGQLHSSALPAPQTLVSRQHPGHGSPADDRDPPDGDGFLDAIERLWVSEGLHAEREVRIGLNNRMLPETAIRMRMVQGAIQIEFTCAERATARWLAGRLDALAAELGARLRADVVASVATESHGVMRSVTWFPGCP